MSDTVFGFEENTTTAITMYLELEGLKGSSRNERIPVTRSEMVEIRASKLVQDDNQSPEYKDNLRASVDDMIAKLTVVRGWI